MKSADLCNIGNIDSPANTAIAFPLSTNVRNERGEYSDTVTMCEMERVTQSMINDPFHRFMLRL